MGLKRELGVFHLTFASITGMIGSGWLFGAFYAASIAGPASIISWIIGALMIMVLALVYAELSVRIPKTGAAAIFPQYTHGKMTTALNGWSLFMGYVSTPPLEMIAAITYLNFITGKLVNSNGFLTPLGMLLSVVFLVLFFVINSIGISRVARFNSGISLLKVIIPLTAVIALTVTFFSVSNFTAGSFNPYGMKAIFSAIPSAGIAFSFLGFRQAVELAGESKNPEKTLPVAIILSVLIATVIYIAVQIAFIGSFQWNGLTVGNWSSIASSQYTRGPLLVLASSLGIAWLAVLLLGDGVISPLGTGNIYQTSTARVAYALGEMGYFPKIFTKLNRFGVPFLALLFDFLIMVIFILPFPSWQSLVSINSGMSILAYATGPLSLMILRKKGESAGFRVPIIQIISPIAFISAILLIYWSGYPYTLYMSIISLVGLVPFLISIKRLNATWKDVRGGIWFLLMLVTIPVISYFGSYGTGIIAFPLDVVTVIIASLAIYFVGLAFNNPSDSMNPQETVGIEEVIAEPA
ncbi:MAG: APC family permease [Thermoplasmata archaeon]